MDGRGSACLAVAGKSFQKSGNRGGFFGSLHNEEAPGPGKPCPPRVTVAIIDRNGN